MYHGHGGKKDEVDDDTARFFKIVDDKILRNYSQPAGIPLLLAALPEHHHLFHSLSHNPFLMEKSLDVYPDSVSLNNLREQSWQLIRPNYLQRLDKLIADYHEAKAKQLGSDNLPEIGIAAIEGRISVLLIAADSQIGGQIDLKTGEVKFEQLSDPDVNDLLDDLAEIALKKSAEVIIVPNENMPSDTGAAAIYRF
jgi:hypothetical protein